MTEDSFTDENLDFSLDDLLSVELAEYIRAEINRTKILIPNVERLRFANEIILQLREILDECGCVYEIVARANPILMTCLYINFITLDLNIDPLHVSLFQEIIGKANRISFSGGRNDGKVEIGIRVMDAFIDIVADTHDINGDN